MLLKFLVASIAGFKYLALATPVSHPVDVISSTESSEFGAYVNPNPKNICEGDELDTLTLCASEVLAKLDECKPDDLACECCALQSMKRDCYGLCPNTQSGNFLAVLYDDCETMNDVNACNLPFKKHDAHVAKFLRPNSRLPVEEKAPDFVLQSTITNTSNETKVAFISHLAGSHESFKETNSTVNDTNRTTNLTGEESLALSLIFSKSHVLLVLGGTIVAVLLV
ncbi:CYFA0S05e04808g1_1 [Cyberlindnera fabianii]|uniref:CYFA0S05e04808g1_1 n=1 Tax=Cyberlindnera fabianii TaxID=36022 RepID=A0A061B1C6_CYBFA|nr:putative GPI-anchored protein 43 [Cyberlindnera fabianii]CDR40816.1 CYFA0S05e04808g1_1 [Cyberlindnera fabianii]